MEQTKELDVIGEGTIMVASWGYSMILTTWVKVLKVSEKTLLVEELQSRSLTQEELEAQNLKTGFLQMYVVPTEEIKERNGEGMKTFRLYNRGTNWTGKPDSFSTKLYFSKWDGKPELEDHCD